MGHDVQDQHGEGMKKPSTVIIVFWVATFSLNVSEYYNTEKFSYRKNNTERYLTVSEHQNFEQQFMVVLIIGFTH